MKATLGSRDRLLRDVVHQWATAHESVVDAAREGSSVDIPDPNEAAREAHSLMQGAQSLVRSQGDMDGDEEDEEMAQLLDEEDEQPKAHRGKPSEDALKRKQALAALQQRLNDDARATVRRALRLDQMRAEARELAVREAVGEIAASGTISGAN